MGNLILNNYKKIYQKNLKLLHKYNFTMILALIYLLLINLLKNQVNIKFILTKIICTLQ